MPNIVSIRAGGYRCKQRRSGGARAGTARKCLSWPDRLPPDLCRLPRFVGLRGIALLHQVHHCRFVLHAIAYITTGSRNTAKLQISCCRRGRKPGLQDEEHGPLKESPPAVQPLSVKQTDLQLSTDGPIEQNSHVGVRNSGFVRYITIWQRRCSLHQTKIHRNAVKARADVMSMQVSCA